MSSLRRSVAKAIVTHLPTLSSLFSRPEYSTCRNSVRTFVTEHLAQISEPGFQVNQVSSGALKEFEARFGFRPTLAEFAARNVAFSLKALCETPIAFSLFYGRVQFATLGGVRTQITNSGLLIAVPQHAASQEWVTMSFQESVVDQLIRNFIPDMRTYARIHASDMELATRGFHAVKEYDAKIDFKSNLSGLLGGDYHLDTLAADSGISSKRAEEILRYLWEVRNEILGIRLEFPGTPIEAYWILAA